MNVYENDDCDEDFPFDHEMHDSLICAYDTLDSFHKWRAPGSPLVTLMAGTIDVYQLIGLDYGGSFGDSDSIRSDPSFSR